MAVLPQGDRREAAEKRAREILYPDLRKRYEEDRLMVQILADALLTCEALAERGGGTQPTLHGLRHLVSPCSVLLS